MLLEFVPGLSELLSQLMKTLMILAAIPFCLSPRSHRLVTKRNYIRLSHYETRSTGTSSRASTGSLTESLRESWVFQDGNYMRTPTLTTISPQTSRTTGFPDVVPTLTISLWYHKMEERVPSSSGLPNLLSMRKNQKQCHFYRCALVWALLT